MYDVVLFDLDGTLTESGIGITRSVAYALRKHGIEELDQKKLNRFVGPPLIGAFMQFYGFSQEEAVQAVEDYREYYAVTGIFENRVYDGVERMLQRLNAAGKHCILATSKPEHFARKIMDHFGLSRYFACIAGATMDEKRTSKADVIAYALQQSGAAGRAVMVGDREHDILGAKAHGMDSVGVLYGYGSREELEAAGATWIVETPEEIVNLV